MSYEPKVYSPLGWCETAPGKRLNLHLSGEVAVGGVIVYAEV